MDFTRTFKIVRDNSGNFGFRIPPDDKPSYNAVLEKCIKARSGWATIKISLPRRYRTTGKGSQSHHLNGHIQQICLETGNDFADVKKAIKQRALKRGYPILQNDNGQPKLDLWGNEQGISETECDTVQCGYLIEEAHSLAAELDIKLYEGEK
jgi:hypothetical protein